MPKLNWDIILSNIRDARDQLEEIERKADSEDRPSEVEFEIMLEHAYHHLNFAWNIRHAAPERYARLKDKDFNRWSKFPKKMHIYKVRKNKRKDK